MKADFENGHVDSGVPPQTLYCTVFAVFGNLMFFHVNEIKIP